MTIAATDRAARLRRGLRAVAHAIGWLAVAAIGLCILLALDDSKVLILIGWGIRLAQVVLAGGLVAVALLAAVRVLRPVDPAEWRRDVGAAAVCVVTSFLALGALPPVQQRLLLDAAMVVTFGPEDVRITGGTGRSLPRRLSEGLGPELRPRRVFLANPGGDVQAGLAAAALLRERGVDTAIVDGDCASACAFMAALFPNRLLAEHGRLGYHDIRAFGASPSVALENRQTLVARLQAAGHATAVVDRMLGSRELVYPARDDLLRDGLVTGCWSSERGQAVPCPAPLPG